MRRDCKRYSPASSRRMRTDFVDVFSTLEIELAQLEKRIRFVESRKGDANLAVLDIMNARMMEVILS